MLKKSKRVSPHGEESNREAMDAEVAKVARDTHAMVKQLGLKRITPAQAFIKMCTNSWMGLGWIGKRRMFNGWGWAGSKSDEIFMGGDVLAREMTNVAWVGMGWLGN